MNNIRIGHGYDVHQLVPGRVLIIGGVHIPNETGALGHSDADVLIHALCDALLGAAAIGDIGRHFPNTDPQWKGISSLILLQKVVEMLNEKGYQVGNIDTTILLQSPQLRDFIMEMRMAISETIGINVANVSIKATTTEKLGFIGKGKGIAAEAVALIYAEKA